VAAATLEKELSQITGFRTGSPSQLSVVDQSGHKFD
jgi:hypothetical protein